MANEKQLIDADELMSDVYRSDEQQKNDVWHTSDIEYLVMAQPTVDAKPVVHGRWLYDSGSGKYFCSACDEYALSFKKDTIGVGELYEVCLTDYCPNCGADMRDGDGNE